MKKISSLIIVAVVAAAGFACTPDKPAAPAPTPAPAPAPVAAPPVATNTAAAGGDAVAEAETIFNTRCVACHGASGKGDGMAAAALNPKPRDYTDKEWQKSVDDAYLAKVILEGGVAVGKSPLMTPNGDLKDKPEVIKALVAKVRTFGQ